MSAAQDFIQRKDDPNIQPEIEKLIRVAEDTRLRLMQKHQTRSFIAMTLGIFFLIAGTAGFGWFFLVYYQIIPAFLCFLAAVPLPFILNLWAQLPMRAYRRYYKTVFMADMANVLSGTQGDLKFFPQRGISAKILAKTGIIPAHDDYRCEDCFMGDYKGIRVIFTEACLLNNKKQVFKGVFVLLQLPQSRFSGHTIISADHGMIRACEGRKWKNLQRMDIRNARFEIFTSVPEIITQKISQSFLDELEGAAKIFEESALSVALFQSKFIFLMIPHQSNMFEASNLNIPIKNQAHVDKCRKEINQILEIIDVFELYAQSLVPSTADLSQAESAT